MSRLFFALAWLCLAGFGAAVTATHSADWFFLIFGPAITFAALWASFVSLAQQP